MTETCPFCGTETTLLVNHLPEECTGAPRYVDLGYLYGDRQDD